MAFPPTIPPATRSDSTVQQTNHANDHNQVSEALTDIVDHLETSFPMAVIGGSYSATTDAGGGINVDLGVTFATAPFVVVTPLRATQQQIAAHLSGSPIGGNTQPVIVTQNDAPMANTSITVRWIAVGVLA